MRILHAVLSDSFYGSERYCIDLAVAQARSGHDVMVLVEDGTSICAEQFRVAISEADQEGNVAGSLRLVEFPRTVPQWLQRPAVAMLMLRLRPDVVHTHLNTAARRVGAVAQALRVPHVMTLHLGYDANEHGGIDGLIALSGKQRETVPADFPGEVTVVWNWLPSRVETGLTRVSAADIAKLRAWWRADEATVVFGSVGRLAPEKGMDTLVRAFRMAFAASSETVRLVIVGEGEQRAELEQMIRGDDRIVLAGQQAQVAPFYRAFDVFVSAARFEPFGLAIIEAMAAGCPLVATSILGTTEFATDPRVLWTEPGKDGQMAFQLSSASRKRDRFKYDMSRLTLGRAAWEIEVFYGRVAARVRR